MFWICLRYLLYQDQYCVVPFSETMSVGSSMWTSIRLEAMLVSVARDPITVSLHPGQYQLIMYSNWAVNSRFSRTICSDERYSGKLHTDSRRVQKRKERKERGIGGTKNGKYNISESATRTWVYTLIRYNQVQVAMQCLIKGEINNRL